MKLFYDDIVCGVDIPELIQGGWLCQNITYAPKEVVDRTELSIKNGEFEDSLMALQFSKPKYISNTIDAYKKWSLKCKTIIFNVNIGHSRNVTAAFVEAGLPCKYLDSTMSPAERFDVLTWFKNTSDGILCNVGIATTGFDEPTIETVIINKATMSMPLWLQMTGRGSRPLAHKSLFIIIDMGGNAITHGDWCQERNWEDLFFNPPKPGTPGVPPVKSCPECDAIVPAGSKTCPHCNYLFPARVAGPEEELGEYIILTKGINIEKLIEDNRSKKEYYPFFKIGTDLSNKAKTSIKNMSDDYANFILHKYLDMIKQWIKLKRIEGHKNITFNKWHKEKAKEHLFNELTKIYPEWQPPLEQMSSAYTPA